MIEQLAVYLVIVVLVLTVYILILEMRLSDIRTSILDTKNQSYDDWRGHEKNLHSGAANERLVKQVLTKLLYEKP